MNVEVGSPEYHAIHETIRRRFVKTGRCESCGREPGVGAGQAGTHWALKPRHEYTLDRADYYELCPSCHKMLDWVPETEAKKPRSPLTGKYLSKVSDDDLREMHRLRFAGWSLRAIASRFDVTHQTVRRVLAEPLDESYLDADEAFLLRIRAERSEEVLDLAQADETP